MSRFDCIIVAATMMIAGYESMSLIGGVAEFLSAHKPQAPMEKSMARFGITCISEAEYEIDTGANWPVDFDCWSLTFVPSFKNGFEFLNVPADSLYAALGFQRGDIVHSINGFALCSPELELMAYQHRHVAKYLDVEFERHGVILVRRYWLH